MIPNLFQMDLGWHVVINYIIVPARTDLSQLYFNLKTTSSRDHAMRTFIPRGNKRSRCLLESNENQRHHGGGDGGGSASCGRMKHFPKIVTQPEKRSA